MIHVYFGDGKGKTTAAFGLALRALGHGWRVHVCQFCKDGSSGEAVALRDGLGVNVVADTPPVLFSFQMDEAQRQESRREHDAHLSQAIELARSGQADLIVLDEALTAHGLGLLDEPLLHELLAAVSGRDGAPEVVLTGHSAPAFVLDAADYVTRMSMERHPYQRGVVAREGVEY